MVENRVYVAEFNRAYGDNIRMAARRLERRWGLNVDMLPHKTTLRIERPADMSWSTFKDALRSVIQPRAGPSCFSARGPATFLSVRTPAISPGSFNGSTEGGTS
jgi:hypothetical protein